MTHTIALLTIGSEILDGRVLDSNSNYLCNQLHNAGLSVSQIITCDDVLDDIVSAIKFSIASNDVLIFTGGLGPTSDDLTREAIASYLGVDLLLDEQALQTIKEIYTRRARAFEPSNQKQALFPNGSEIISNRNGTAPGFAYHLNLNGKAKLLISLPGVPSELKPMFEEDVLNRVKRHFPNSSSFSQSEFKIFGLPESVVGAKVKSLQLPPEIIVSYRAHYPEIHVILKSKSKGLLDEVSQKVTKEIGLEFIFSRNIRESLEEVVHGLLLDEKLTICGAESCSGGIISSMLTNLPGSSAYFLGTAVTYANSAKQQILSVPSEILEKYGAVSAETAVSMAVNAQKLFSADISYSITGIAGPGGATEGKPVGLYYIAITSRGSVSTHQYLHIASRRKFRQYASYMVLDLIRRKLLGIKPHPDHVLN